MCTSPLFPGAATGLLGQMKGGRGWPCPVKSQRLSKGHLCPETVQHLPCDALNAMKSFPHLWSNFHTIVGKCCYQNALPMVSFTWSDRTYFSPPLLHTRPVVHDALQDHGPLGNEVVVSEVLQRRAAKVRNRLLRLQGGGRRRLRPGALERTRP